MIGYGASRHSSRRRKKKFKKWGGEKKKEPFFPRWLYFFNLEIGFLFEFVFQDVQRLKRWPLAICFTQFKTLLIIVFFWPPLSLRFSSTCSVTVKMCICSEQLQFSRSLPESSERKHLLLFVKFKFWGFFFSYTLPCCRLWVIPFMSGACHEPSPFAFSVKMCYILHFSHSLTLYEGGSRGKESACSAGDLGLIPGVGRIPWRRQRQPTSVFLPGEPHGQRSLGGHGPQGHKRDRYSWVTDTHFSFS